MCGITGIYAFNEQATSQLKMVSRAVARMSKRGPDGNGIITKGNVSLGHARLAIIDTTNAASQPFTDASGRYTIVFNGEFLNFAEHRRDLHAKGVSFSSQSDTEVLLYLYIHEGPACLKKVCGFFALAIYDNVSGDLFLARDRVGKKPLLYYHDRYFFAFASEMKSLVAYNINKQLDHESLLAFLQLNYIPAPHSIFSHVKKLMPGCFMVVDSKGNASISQYYTIENKPDTLLGYHDAEGQLVKLLDEAVRKRLISDVPLGAFLSGGIDSSVVVALATRHVDNLQTFSIGYKDEPFFDETHYANLVAKKFGTTHTVFSLTNNDLFNVLFDALDYIDEPFADSSALALYILSQQTRKHVTVALSGDGADEMFAGYHKHMAHLRAITRPITNQAVLLSMPIMHLLPKSRNSKAGNMARQMHRYGQGLRLSTPERYWRWCSFAPENEARKLLNIDVQETVYAQRKQETINILNGNSDFNNILLSDMHLVLANDMLVKVDLMSMANSLEVRSPFLDTSVVDFAFSLPSSFKINNTMKKRIVQDAFRDVLPAELYKRPKKGFEVPLLKWLRNELNPLVNNYLLNDSFLADQKIFNPAEIKKLHAELISNNPGESHARIWALLVFQHWYKQYA